MPLPKRKHSKTVQRLRRTHYKLESPNSGECPKCGEPVAPHRACGNCGNYRGRQILKAKES